MIDYKQTYYKVYDERNRLRLVTPLYQNAVEKVPHFVGKSIGKEGQRNFCPFTKWSLKLVKL